MPQVPTIRASAITNAYFECLSKTISPNRQTNNPSNTGTYGFLFPTES
jgi:hypothetical protein